MKYFFYFLILSSLNAGCERKRDIHYQPMPLGRDIYLEVGTYSRLKRQGFLSEQPISSRYTSDLHEELGGELTVRIDGKLCGTVSSSGLSIGLSWFGDFESEVVISGSVNKDIYFGVAQMDLNDHTIERVLLTEKVGSGRISRVFSMSDILTKREGE